MLRISSDIWSHQSIKEGKIFSLKNILLSNPAPITSFKELVRAVAELSYGNPEHILFFRGQTKEYFKRTIDDERFNSFYPSIYRPQGQRLTQSVVKHRFSDLDKRANQLLISLKNEKIRGVNKLNNFPELTWAILQHYEVCPTPLLDVTHSLRVAASFALNGSEPEGFLYVFGFPHPNGSITYSVESEIINIRLLSICPPEAQRPYFQEGFLVGSFPSKRLRRHPSLDVGARIIAKFNLHRKRFWDNNFHAIPHEALFPKEDKVEQICSSIKTMKLD